MGGGGGGGGGNKAISMPHLMMTPSFPESHYKHDEATTRCGETYFRSSVSLKDFPLAKSEKCFWTFAET